MAQLVIGPLLRHVDEESATIWVETSEPCAVTVRAGEARSEERTFTVHGHHYALVDVTVPDPPFSDGRGVPYRVELDGEIVWPLPGMPPSTIRPLTALRRLVFGTCRTSVPHDDPYVRTHGVDVLRAYGLRLMESGERPDLMIMLGDQVYADEPSPGMREFIAARRSGGPEEVVDFEEYAELYRRAWSDPPVRWLMATVPTLMMFDDHDIRDDWNTSAAWRERMAGVPWWRRRIVSGLGAYYVYQHLGNLTAGERAADPVLAALKAGDGGAALDAFAVRADAEPASTRWSYRRDIGSSRLIMLDSRCDRVLTPGARRIIDDAQRAWLEESVAGDVDHLLVGSSLPVLLPMGIHHVESWNEAVCDGAWGRQAARWGERLRRFLDLEHWAAFRGSFEHLARLLADIASGGRGRPPATVLLLSGDVHYSYLASVRPRRGRKRNGLREDEQNGERSGTRGRIHQIVCSPIRNPLSRTLRLANVVASFAVAGPLGRLLALAARLPGPPIRWRLAAGPWFQNALATVDLTPDTATVTWRTHDAELGSVRLP
ncbi:alkaline phosphatase D family protein [Microtetraspora sp. NBRC 16547]|uniref:alkaline phosphatase D family protein n=1 Tax=Microtetraspora sp. NBRC 16547 TaxID=3030993 RepID=UPI0024A2900E|nr:alkaline phosphatase D family protein [Microtetraspora sp. NBRC 16547]GLW97865.1 metallophosphatase [Microtetraspora sp. NBRC 16547]